MTPMNKCCVCIPIRAGVMTILLLSIFGGIYSLIQNVQIITNPYIIDLGSTGLIALVLNSLTILVCGFGLIVVGNGDPVQPLKIFSVLFIFIIVLHFAYAIYLVVVTSSNGLFDYLMFFVIIHFIEAILGGYFAKVIADYATIIKHEKGYTSSPRRTEESNMTNNQVVTSY
ncbi:hypothetical protein F8M41_020891 [Gigaspora margarita]|uniref:Uncharacterized protein n=1 Tax=Gigaspora margarita TaxID=4874 RepID=A0A8H4EJ96_GIGMA|nr:hypothetical protein F8M41_020891 [Gigaspora margarita]